MESTGLQKSEMPALQLGAPAALRIRPRAGAVGYVLLPEGAICPPGAGAIWRCNAAILAALAE